ncbi:hypothetical protein [Streptomyces sp. NPDC020747]|uniref:hypothetical protein n=1 Tax=Streptomyces sp. NPDC020747 TaxID=3365086 RepID=UPI003797FDEF
MTVRLRFAVLHALRRPDPARPGETGRPDRTRAELHDYQRHLGEALGAIHTAPAAVRHTAEDHMETCRRNVTGEAPFTFRDASTYWTHIGPSMAEPFARHVGCDRLGLPSHDIPLIP